MRRIASLYRELGVPGQIYMGLSSDGFIGRDDTGKGNPQGITSLSDGFPYLILSQASLDDLNARIRSSSDPVPDLGMERFRPNLVVAGGEAFQEDTWKEIMIGAARFALVKTCGRCVIPTTDQRTGERGKEPTRTLASYRKRGNRVEFGMNAMASAEGTVRAGDPVRVLR